MSCHTLEDYSPDNTAVLQKQSSEVTDGSRSCQGMVKTARGRSRTAVCIFPVWSVSSNVSSSSCRGQQRLVTCQAKLRRLSLTNF
ncbi:TPA: hypothetical protein ACH3X2_004886 [Trebouxia sp. C0005]